MHRPRRCKASRQEIKDICACFYGTWRRVMPSGAWLLTRALMAYAAASSPSPASPFHSRSLFLLLVILASFFFFCDFCFLLLSSSSSVTSVFSSPLSLPPSARQEIWNQLPHNIKNIWNLNTFKMKFKELLNHCNVKFPFMK